MSLSGNQALFVIKNAVDAARMLPMIKGRKALVLALTPSSQAFLSSRGIAYQKTSDYFHKKASRMVAMDVQRQMIDVDRVSRDVFSEFPLQTYSHTFCFWLRMHMSTYYFFNHVIDSMLSANELADVYIAKGYDEAWFQILSHVTSLVGMKHAVAVREVGVPDQKISWIEATIKNRIHWALYYLSLAKLRFIGKKREIICVSSPSYNLPRATTYLNGLYSKDMDVCYLSAAGSIRNYLKSLINPKSIMFFCMPCLGNKSTGLSLAIRKCLEGISVSDSDVNPQTKRFTLPDSVIDSLMNELASIGAKSRYLGQLLMAPGIKMVLSQMALGETRLLGELAQKLGIPSYLISHGSHVPTVDPCAQSEWASHGEQLISNVYDTQLIQSPWTIAHLDSIGKHTKNILSGPILFSKCGRIRRSNQLTILHAGTPKHYDALRLCIYETLDEYINHLNDLILATSHMERLHLRIRFRPIKDFSEDDLKGCLIAGSHYSIEVGGDLSDSLSDCDLLVSYSSTVIEEALNNKIPVLLYSSDDRYCHIPLADTGGPIKDVAYAGSYAVLSDYLKRFAVFHNSARRVPDHLFNRHILNPSENDHYQEVVSA